MTENESSLVSGEIFSELESSEDILPINAGRPTTANDFLFGNNNGYEPSKPPVELTEEEESIYLETFAGSIESDLLKSANMEIVQLRKQIDQLTAQTNEKGVSNAFIKKILENVIKRLDAGLQNPAILVKMATMAKNDLYYTIEDDLS